MRPGNSGLIGQIEADQIAALPLQQRSRFSFAQAGWSRRATGQTTSNTTALTERLATSSRRLDLTMLGPLPVVAKFT
jgi:hypothetical protein